MDSQTDDEHSSTVSHVYWRVATHHFDLNFILVYFFFVHCHTKMKRAFEPDLKRIVNTSIPTYVLSSSSHQLTDLKAVSYLEMLINRHFCAQFDNQVLIQLRPAGMTIPRFAERPRSPDCLTLTHTLRQLLNPSSSSSSTSSCTQAIVSTAPLLILWFPDADWSSVLETSRVFPYALLIRVHTTFPFENPPVVPLLSSGTTDDDQAYVKQLITTPAPWASSSSSSSSSPSYSFPFTPLDVSLPPSEQCEKLLSAAIPLKLCRSQLLWEENPAAVERITDWLLEYSDIRTEHVKTELDAVSAGIIQSFLRPSFPTTTTTIEEIEEHDTGTPLPWMFVPLEVDAKSKKTDWEFQATTQFTANGDRFVRPFVNSAVSTLLPWLNEQRKVPMSELQKEALKDYAWRHSDYFRALIRRPAAERGDANPRFDAFCSIFEICSPLPQGIALFRGGYTFDFGELEVGSEFFVNWFFSTSWHPTTAHNFAFSKSPDSAVYVFLIADSHVKGISVETIGKGTTELNAQGNMREREVIIQHNTYGTVLRIEEKRQLDRKTSYSGDIDRSGQGKIVYVALRGKQ
jgi:hypothetical protein